MLTGPDLSTWQPDAKLDWAALRAHSDFVFYRATYGLTADDELAAHRANAQRQGFALTGAYAYLRPGDPTRQAHVFLDRLGRVHANEALVLHAEAYSGWGPGAADVIAWAKAVRAAQPRATRLLFCSWSYWADVLAADPEVVELFDALWIESPEGASPFGIVPNARFWQFTDGTDPSGVETPGVGRCGRSYFDGEVADLRALATLRNASPDLAPDVSLLLRELEMGLAVRAGA